ncbi:tyrosine-type recombinase/integrase [Micromonospora sp. ALFpr18c]|uniref:tyrosine-type recombinase/integrase n=1 Tax=Micromonospora sp. ALFpr18c TaxID=1458665 RepID=UPI00124B150B|nr:site-specific integrase [Micromonospora sp. ALFpr18c]KAB1922363.1 tyrosine-type recombinase/integrase [Micromonospora sp. ALFpr18c]
MTVIPLPRPGGAVPLVAATDRFLDRFRDAPATAAAYAETLARLRAVAGDHLGVGELTAEHYQATMERWATAAPATFNKHLAGLRSFAAYARRQEWLTTDPARRLERRKVTRVRDKAIPRARLDRLFTDNRHQLRERVLWRMLYETCARADEILGLDAPDLDMEFRRALVVEKGGNRAYVHWETPTARLLPRLLAGRTTGPVFLADRRAPTSGYRAQAPADVDPATGRGRLSYPRAEYLFKQATIAYDPRGLGYTLHQLRHSGLTHLAGRGRSAAELQAKSRHRHLATLGIYVQLGEETSARITAENDGANRRHRT